MSFLYFLLIGAVAGWLAGLLTKGRGYGLLGNSAIGVIGAVIGGVLFRFVGLAATGLLGSLVTATVGALVLLFVAKKLR